MSKTEIIYGFHAVSSLLQTAPQSMVKLYVQQGRNDGRIHEILQLAETHNISYYYLTKKELDEKTAHQNHQGVVADVLSQQKTFSEHDLELLLQQHASPLFLILDGIQDPHNLGACLRTANAAGVTAVIIPKDKSVSLTSTVKKVASGAAEVTPLIQVTNLARTIRHLQEQGVWIYGFAEQATKSLFECQLSGPIALILGNEAKGLRHLTREHCDELLKIPMLGTVESLNVSVATGVALFEVVRQRQKNTK